VQVARNAARAIGWLFVALIAFHAVRAASQAHRAASDGNWAHAAELIAIALVATAIVFGALVSALRSARARR
jgi:hypothetical protein